MSMYSSWAALLDSFEEQLRRQEAALRGEVEAPAELTFPVMEEPIPSELTPRAVWLLERSRSLERLAAEKVNRRRPRVRAYGGSGRPVGEL